MNGGVSKTKATFEGGIVIVMNVLYATKAKAIRGEKKERKKQLPGEMVLAIMVTSLRGNR